MRETRYRLDPRVEAAGLVDFVWHETRHTAASRWVMAGVPLAAVAQCPGNRSIQMTMRYARLQSENENRAFGAMTSFYRKASESQTAASAPDGLPQGSKLM
jgi:integrase